MNLAEIVALAMGFQELRDYDQDVVVVHKTPMEAIKYYGSLITSLDSGVKVEDQVEGFIEEDVEDLLVTFADGSVMFVDNPCDSAGSCTVLA